MIMSDNSNIHDDIFIDFSEELDVIALKKLVNFVNLVMEKYFGFVRLRVQLEVSNEYICISCTFVYHIYVVLVQKLVANLCKEQ